jgi:saccharopine dehydrogenase (NAD+, L-lysine-forming)
MRKKDSGKKVLIGIRREDKNPWERRVPIIPADARELMENLPLEIWIQPSRIRILSDEDYRGHGVTVSEDLTPCSIVLAVKEIPSDFFQDGRVYMFFSHTIKGQPHNMPMLRRMMDRRATLIDYERIVDGKGRRLVFFGRQAGQAGMIDSLWALGRRLLLEGTKNPFSSLRQTIEYASLVAAKEAIAKVGWQIHNHGLTSSLAPLVIGFAGYGHVSQGAQEIFNLLPFEEIPPGRLPGFFKARSYSSRKLYKTVFKEEDMVKPKAAGETFGLQDYYEHPEKYRPFLEKSVPYLTVLMNAIFWSPRYPRFVTKKFLKKLYGRKTVPRLRVIGDISCDVGGAMECTLKCTNPADPVFTYDTRKDRAQTGFSGKGPVVMAVDNLPAEISLESSVFFSQILKPFISGLAAADFSRDFAHCHLPLPLKRAAILFRGKLTPEYRYMRNFLIPSKRS